MSFGAHAKSSGNLSMLAEPFMRCSQARAPCCKRACKPWGGSWCKNRKCPELLAKRLLRHCGFLELGGVLTALTSSAGARRVAARAATVWPSGFLACRAARAASSTLLLNAAPAPDPGASSC